MTFTKSFASILLILLGFSIASGQNPAQVRKLKKELAKITGSKEFKTATIGFCLMDVETGKILVEENAEKSLIPASTMKLITTGAGLALLGDTFRFKTEFKYYGIDKKNSLNGVLEIHGTSDPTLGSTRWPETNIDTVLTGFTKYLHSNHIDSLNLGLAYIADYIKQGDVPPGYTLEDVVWKYGAWPQNLNIFENVVNESIPFTQQLMQDFTTKPPSPLIRHFLFTLDEDKKKSIELNKTYPYALIDSIYQLNYETNELNFAPYNIFDIFLKHKLQTEHIAFGPFNNQPGWSYHPTMLNSIYTHYSPQLVDITAKTNNQSINLYAECILRGIGIQKYGPSTLDTSIAAVKTFWKNEVGDLKGLRMTDGSGLSRSNLCTPLLFCKMLSSYTKRDNFNSFYSTIPVAGKDGTVKNFAKGTAADGNAHIKSGSMSRVKCYAGYVTGKNGKLYAVSVMFNNFEPDATVTSACANLIGKVAEIKGGKPKKTFVVNRSNK